MIRLGPLGTCFLAFLDLVADGYCHRAIVLRLLAPPTLVCTPAARTQYLCPEDFRDTNCRD